MHDRRYIVAAGAAFFATSNLRVSPALSQAPPVSFDQLLIIIQQNPAFAQTTAEAGEWQFRQWGPDEDQRRGNPTLPRRWTSDKAISQDAIDLIIAFEVSSKAAYERLYSQPIWPRGASGVTVGIGYDLGYQSQENIGGDWDAIIDQQSIERFKSVQGVKGSEARTAAISIRDVSVPWTAALENFRLVLKFYAGETLRYFPNSNELGPASFGALVSLVYNRGSSSAQRADDPLDRRREIGEIKQLCLQRRFDAIPDQIRSMNRLWQDDPNASGLVRRRQLEAVLFETGLR